MKVSVFPNVLQEPQWFPILDVIVLIMEDGRHIFAADEITDILASKWIGQRTVNTRDFIRLAATARSVDALADGRTIVIDSCARRGGVESADRTTIVHPLDAIIFLSTPFQVIVENEWFDGGFILWMAKGLGFTQLLHAYRNNRFVFRHAGGKDSIVRSASTFSGSVWPRPDKSTDRAFRYWMCVVLDNDARDPNDDPNRKIVEEAGLSVSFVHQLVRRSIESYLPKTSLLKFDSSNTFRQRVNALFRMTPDQLRHYHMKRGFRFEKGVEPSRLSFMSSNQVTAEQKALYGGLADADWELLKNGLGRNLSEIFVDPQSRPNTNQEDLVSAEARGELLNLFRSIYENM